MGVYLFRLALLSGMLFDRIQFDGESTVIHLDYYSFASLIDAPELMPCFF